jgi:integrase
LPPSSPASSIVTSSAAPTRPTTTSSYATPAPAAARSLTSAEAFKAAAARAGLRPVRFHDLRHTFGTRMAAAGVPLRTIQEWMGHRDFKTTLIYADYQPAAEEAALVEPAFSRLLMPSMPRMCSQMPCRDPRV